MTHPLPSDIEMDTRDARGTIAGSMVDLIGETPMVRMDRIGSELKCTLVGKLELLNPGGSVKDRPAMAMVQAAEEAGILEPGVTIVEPTSGNTGLGLAMIAARRGYRCVFVMPDKVAAEKVAALRAFGAEIVLCPAALPTSDPRSYYSIATKLAENMPRAFMPNQYENLANPAVHFETTGPEIWKQTAGRITHFVAGIGTGGTITGVGRFLKQQNPHVTVVGADPEGSIYSGQSAHPYLVEGIGEDFWPKTYDPSVVDKVITVSDRESFRMARRAAREEGLFVGGSSGTAMSAALSIGRDLGGDDLVVVLLADSGRGYTSSFFNDDWLQAHGLADPSDD